MIRRRTFLNKSFAKELFALFTTERFWEDEIHQCRHTEMNAGCEDEHDRRVARFLRDVPA